MSKVNSRHADNDISTGQSNLNEDIIETAILWTRQDKRMLEDLNNKGRFIMSAAHIEEKQMDIADYYIKLYKWFSEKANNFVPRPPDANYPIWCSISEAYMLRKTDDTVVLKLEVPRNQVIFFHGGKWDMVLNHMYVPKSEQDDIAFKHELKNRGINNSFSLIEGRNANFYPDIKRKIIASWDRVFEIENWNDIFTVQANLWEIKKEWILGIEQ